MMIDLTDKGWAVLGPRGGGKSVLVKHILGLMPSHLVYDPLNEHQGNRRYVPTVRESVPELESAIKALVIPKRAGGYAVPAPSLFVLDEANRYLPPKPAPLPAAVGDLNDFARHWGVSCGYVARRPVQLNQDITELAAYLFVFRLTGRLDCKWLDGLYEGLGDTVRRLKPYHFVVLENGVGYSIHAPVPLPRK
jgi:energy-coupling factor transporter ATP-binding protein EcfA2